MSHRAERFFNSLSRVRGFCYLAITSAVCLGTADAQVTGISYSISPAAEYVRFGDASALKGGFGVGGGVGFGFGEYLEVSGIVQFLPSLETDWVNLPDAYLRADLTDRTVKLQMLQSIAPRNVSARKYGGRIRVNVGDFRYKPYVTVGTGVLQMSPDQLETASVIYGELGVGATFSIVDRFALSVGLRNLSYRLNPASTLLSADEIAGLGVAADDFEQQRVRNLGVEASIRFYLAGRSDGKLTEMDRAMMSQFQGGNFRVAIEPVLGQINFNSALGISGSRAVAGVSAGFDLGPYIGIRGFYMRDTQQAKILEGGVPRKFGKAQYYGGELQLRFNQEFGGGLTPYGLLGGGFFSNNNDASYQTDAGLPFDSRYFAIAGGGVELPLGGALRIHGEVRGIFMSSQEVAVTAAPSSVSASPLYTLGVSFNIGGSGRTLGSSIDERFAKERSAAEVERLAAKARQADIEARQMVLEQEVLALQSKLASAVTEAKSGTASMESVMAKLGESIDSTAVMPMVDGLIPRDSVTVANVGKVVAGMRTRADENYISDQHVTIPVPKVGEIYIRYGDVAEMPVDVMAPPVVVSQSGRVDYGAWGGSSGMTAEQIRTIIREELATSQASLRDSNKVAIEGVEARLGQALSLEAMRMRVLAMATDSTNVVPDSIKVIKMDSVRIDSMKFDSLGAVSVDSLSIAPGSPIKMDSLRVGSLGAVRLDSLRVDSTSVDSVRIKNAPIKQ